MTAPEAFFWVAGTGVVIWTLCDLIDHVLDWVERRQNWKWVRFLEQEDAIRRHPAYTSKARKPKDAA